MSFPPATVTPPSLTNWQWYIGGITLGQGQGASGYGVQYADGLDMPAMRSGDSDRPVDQGEFTGNDFLKGRDLALQFARFSGTSYQLGQATAQLNAALASYLPSAITPFAGEVETPIWTCRPGFGQIGAMVRLRKDSQRSDRMFAQSKLSQPIVGFHATDPRLYGPTVATILPAPSFVRGLKFNFNFTSNGGLGLSFGGGSAIAEVTINNTGTIEMRPLLTITGPCTVPAFANASISGIPTIAYNLTMNAGDTLVVDLDGETATYYVAGSSVGVNRGYLLVAGSTFWNLPPGLNTIQFSTSDTSPVAATLEVAWAPAYISVV